MKSLLYYIEIFGYLDIKKKVCILEYVNKIESFGFLIKYFGNVDW